MDAGLNPCDFDGDGRHELFSWDEPYHLFIGWDRDRRPLVALVELSQPIPGSLRAVADLGGDGRAEVISSSSRAVNISRIDPITGDRQRIGGWMSPDRVYGIFAVNLDADLEPELVVLNANASSILDFIDGVEAPPSATYGPRSFFLYSFGRNGLVSGDIDLDGVPELISQSGGIAEICSNRSGQWTTQHLLVPERMMDVSMLSDGGARWSDLDRDGDLDLLVARSDGFSVHLNRQIDRPETSSPQYPRLRVITTNPGSDEVRLLIRVRTSGPVSLGLFDVSGRRIWSSTRHAIGDRWLDLAIGRASTGHSLASGVYFLRVEGDGRAATRRIILAR